MRGINKVFVSGNVTRDFNFGELSDGSPVCSFTVVATRYSNKGPVSAWIKVNAYLGHLVSLCEQHLKKGVYVLVEGELMNRDGQYGRLMEVRAKELIFMRKEG